MCYVDICFYLKRQESSTNETKSEESYFSNQDTFLTSHKKTQW